MDLREEVLELHGRRTTSHGSARIPVSCREQRGGFRTREGRHDDFGLLVEPAPSGRLGMRPDAMSK